MGRAVVSRRFERAPSQLRYYGRALFARRSALLPDGAAVPRLEGRIDAVRARPGHLAAYRANCGFDEGASLPVTYPHVLAMPLHLALLTDPAFVVRLMGLVHIANIIEWRAPLPADAAYTVDCWVEGHRDTDRGQEFDLYTEFSRDGQVAWHECCTLLARRRASGAQAARTARATLKAPRPAEGQAVGESSFGVDHPRIRRYGRLSGDLNPIHLADVSARWFGFDRAVAHGMWSMARALAGLGTRLYEAPGRATVDFKMPLFLPAQVRLAQWQDGAQRVFVLKDGASERPHLAGVAVPA